LESAIKITLTLSVITAMFAEGLGIRGSDLAYLAKQPRLLLRSMIAVDVLVPVAVLLVILLVRPAAPVAIALACLAASPTAPLSLIRIRRSGAAASYAAGMHMILGTLAVATVPLTLALLSAALRFNLAVQPLAVALTVLRVILLPLGLGMGARALTPQLAARVRAPLQKVALAALLVAVGAVLVSNARKFLEIGVRSYLAMALCVLAALVIGYVMAPRRPAEQLALSLESGSRNLALAMLIATTRFEPANALGVLVPYIVVFLIVSSAFTYLVQHQRPVTA
jgi:bile acid:Na+ symporter, BASS family